MYLKSLELQGFKSFPDKILLEFGKGLTAVVGPNGSGKSNIGDAVRWVLGEQSSKTLRGSKMEDVIFSGTQLRKPVGFAQVTLNIDNTKGLLQVPAEHVSVTRKLYRSGESEYMINGAQVRLKDITELFMDTGLGRDGYSIIGQGRVAEIVSAKSNERREIFEEAAGISKFRYKKEEAERRLSAADDNILRLRDIIGELEGRVEPLRLQSEKAEKFLKLSDEKKRLEVSFWIARLGELKGSLSDLEEKLLINQGGYENINAEIQSAEDEIQKCYQEMQKCTAFIDELQAKILENEQNNSQIHASIAVCENDIAHSKEKISEIERQQAGAEESDRQLIEKIEDRKKALKSHGEEAVKEQEALEAMTAQLDSLSLESSQFESDYEEVQTKLNQLYIKQSEFRFSIATAENNQADYDAQISGLKEKEALAHSVYDSYVKEQEELFESKSVLEEKLSELQNKHSGYSRLYQNKAEKLEAAQNEYQKILLKQKENEQRINLLTDLENSMEGFAHSVKEVIKSGRQGRIGGIHGSVAQLIRVEDKYSLAVETALGGALQNIIVENEDSAKMCIRFLKEQNAGRATFLPITSVKGTCLSQAGLENEDGFVALASEIISCDNKYHGIINSLLGRIAVAEDMDMAARIAKKYGYKFKIVTLDGQVIHAGGSFTGGSNARSAGVLTRKNEITALKSELERLSAKTGALLSDNQKLQAERDKLYFDLEGVKEEITLIGNDLIRCQSEEKRLSELTVQAKEQSEAISIQLLTLTAKTKEQKEAMKSASESLIKCEEEIKSAEDIISESQGQKDVLHQKREELSSLLSEKRLKELELRKECEAIRSEISNLEETRVRTKENSGELLKQIKAQQELISEKLAAIEAEKKKLSRAFEQVSFWKTEIFNSQTKHRSLEQSATVMRETLKQHNDQREQVSREETRLQERKISIQKDYDSIISELWEQYSLARSDAEKIAEPVEDMALAQKQVNELRSKIRGLGTVNVAAIEEYKEVSERYKFLSGQLEDVELSKNELEKLISELTETMKKRFSDSFEVINRNFKEIFVELFGGGKAELSLTEPENVLESGIEINVAPPGKVIKNLSLLSGGEQAFVAIAIYFAILKLKPAPFCILDEIEAALDDVNVTKYAQYLRNFTNTTQFILVTHRRGTMEEADVLYGVTMQQKGVSKLLKLDQAVSYED